MFVSRSFLVSTLSVIVYALGAALVFWLVGAFMLGMDGPDSSRDKKTWPNHALQTMGVGFFTIMIFRAIFMVAWGVEAFLMSVGFDEIWAYGIGVVVGLTSVIGGTVWWFEFRHHK